MPSPFDFFFEVREMRDELDTRLTSLEEKLDALHFLLKEKVTVDWYGDGK